LAQDLEKDQEEALLAVAQIKLEIVYRRGKKQSKMFLKLINRGCWIPSKS
jgi:hypothetical protein